MIIIIIIIITINFMYLCSKLIKANFFSNLINKYKIEGLGRKEAIPNLPHIEI